MIQLVKFAQYHWDKISALLAVLDGLLFGSCGVLKPNIS